jgi:hypothetical protein
MKITKGLGIIIISAILVGIIRFFGYHHPLMFWFIGVAAMGIAVKVDEDIPNTNK